MNLIIILLVLITIYSLYKLKNHKDNFNVKQSIKENLDNVNDDKEKYIDVSVLKELSNLTKTLNEDGLTIDGDLKITGKFNQIPSGFITMWYPKDGKKNAYSYTEIKSEIPEGWLLCDGEGGKTPDLRGRFVRMYSNNMQENDSYTLSEMNGLKTFDRDVNSNLSDSVSYEYQNNNSVIVEMKTGTEGGTDHKKLDIAEMPNHGHNYRIKHGHGFFKLDQDISNKKVSDKLERVKTGNRSGINTYDSKSGGYRNLKDTIHPNYKHDAIDDEKGEDFGHNVVPPFFTVVYIQKV